MTTRPLSVLVVESNPADAYITVQAFKQAGLTEEITVIDDGQRALDHLEQASAPDLILLDLRLAPISGLEVLRKLRADARLNVIPVAMMSGSESSEDVHDCYRSGANCYIKKPSNLDDFLRSMKIFYEFWGSVAVLPPKIARLS